MSGDISTGVAMSAMHLIRIPNKKEYKRAIMALLEVLQREHLALPDYQMVVTDEHIQALERAKVTFRYLSKTTPNGKKPAPVQP
jgi:hypothetical protein